MFSSKVRLLASEMKIFKLSYLAFDSRTGLVLSNFDTKESSSDIHVTGSEMRT